MPVNPLVAAIAAFGQGEEKGRELKRRGERDFQADVQAQRQAERQSMLDKAQQVMQQFTLAAPERAEQQRVKVQGEQEAKRRELANDLRLAMQGDEAAKARVAANDPTYVDALLKPPPQEEFTGAAIELGKDKDKEGGMYIRGNRGTMQRVGAAPPKDMTPYQAASIALRQQGGSGGGKMSAALQAKVVMNQRLGTQIDDVLKEMEQAVVDKRNVTGPIVGRLPGNATAEGVGFAQPDQILRRKLNAIENQRLYDQSGKAVTVAEYARQIGAMPSAKVDEGLNVQSLRALKKILDEETRLIRLEAGQGNVSVNPGDFVQGGNVPSFEEWKASKKKGP